MSHNHYPSPKYDEIASQKDFTDSPTSKDSLLPDYLDSDDHVGSNSKKIRKKRNAYQKIDDDTRVKLLEAVQ